MEENTYILEIIDNLGLAINEKNNTEIISNFPIKIDKKNMEYYLDTNLNTFMQPLGTFLVDFLNTNFENYNEYCNLFLKYGMIFLDSKKLKKDFQLHSNNIHITQDYIKKTLEKNRHNFIKLQYQADEILDYCFLHPNNKARNFKPIERFYVLKRISSTLTLLNEGKAECYYTSLFSSIPGDNEKEIYDFLSQRKNKVTDLDLIIPHNVEFMLCRSLLLMFKEKIYIKICKNCSKFFIAANKAYDYCTNIAPNESTKTCRQVGRANKFNEIKNNDPILKLYYKVYSRKSMMKFRNPDISLYASDFNKYKSAGKKKVDKYKKGLITSEEFKNWIEKNI